MLLNPIESVKQQFLKLFSGIGKLEGEYEIELKPSHFLHQRQTCPIISPTKSQERTSPHGRAWSDFQSGAAYRLVCRKGSITEM